MNAETLTLIRKECEKIEKDPGFGNVLISIENGCSKLIRPTPTIVIQDRLDKKKEVV